ncbi:MAG: DNA-binding response regulator [Oceanospirillaceae bacterium]|uniref:response regulator transcription factor n=1 Tax=unclassified Thalassolituus TaxID=2624967 RepID=UPI000C0B963F|nr:MULTISPECIES: response regulator transcription factor [unclassified Thalassolituus]MAK92596.1 DNA-binding response regulator [Thalassolituus sp.]MAS26513.1 DNA-binding response regulator [Oceanospirillaceae bacterium]MBS52475.1 DNA-binding response regulator [Oceanospirillaceae bacterium]|tara:strand:- start:298 stop:966 length:669 start_codon:yes stop_codon:yes gene_type:complete
MRILIVEDERPIREQITRGLEACGWQVDQAQDGRDGYFQASEYPYDLAIIDLGLPHMDGIEVIRRLRSDGCQYPLLILTARGGWKSRVEGLEAGGDDYLEKPFHMEELQARAKALLRRTTGHSSVIAHGPLALDTDTQTASLDGRQMELTAYEFKILDYLIRHPQQVVGKTTLTDYLYAQDFERDSNVIEVLMGRLRKKLAAADGYAPIRTLRGRGYQFVMD